MCIRRETREKARRSLAFSRVSKPHTHITHMLRQCTSIVYVYTLSILGYIDQHAMRFLRWVEINSLFVQRNSFSLQMVL